MSVPVERLGPIDMELRLHVGGDPSFRAVLQGQRPAPASSETSPDAPGGLGTIEYLAGVAALLQRYGGAQQQRLQAFAQPPQTPAPSLAASFASSPTPTLIDVAGEASRAALAGFDQARARAAQTNAAFGAPLPAVAQETAPAVAQETAPAGLREVVAQLQQQVEALRRLLPQAAAAPTAAPGDGVAQRTTRVKAVSDALDAVGDKVGTLTRGTSDPEALADALAAVGRARGALAADPEAGTSVAGRRALAALRQVEADLTDEDDAALGADASTLAARAVALEDTLHETLADAPASDADTRTARQDVAADNGSEFRVLTRSA